MEVLLAAPFSSVVLLALGDVVKLASWTGGIFCSGRVVVLFVAGRERGLGASELFCSVGVPDLGDGCADIVLTRRTSSDCIDTLPYLKQKLSDCGRMRRLGGYS